MSKDDIKKIFILGAGSSIEHSNGLFPPIEGFFSKAIKSRVYSRGDFKQIIDYAKAALGKNVFTKSDTTDIESFFTHVEIELERNPASQHVLLVRQQLLAIIQKLLLKLEEELVIHKTYQSFVKGLMPKHTIVSFNRDLLLDNALYRKRILKQNNNKDNNAPNNKINDNKINDNKINNNQYTHFVEQISSLGETSAAEGPMHKPYSEWDPGTGYYLKVHGSIDWYYCPNNTCEAANRVFPLLEPSKTHYCPQCHGGLELLLVSALMSQALAKYPVVRRTWNMAAREISCAEELIIWGYSLAPGDFHSTWLLRQARMAPLKKLVLINPAVVSGKKEKRIDKKFVDGFYNLFRGIIDKEEVYLFESYEDYVKDNTVVKKYDLGARGPEDI